MTIYQEKIEQNIKKLELKIKEFAQLPPKSVESEANLFNQVAITLEELQVTTEELEIKNQELIVKNNQIEIEKKRYQELFELTPECYIVTDKFGIIKEANQAARNLFNQIGNWLIGKPIFSLVSDDNRQVFRQQLYQLRECPDKISDWEISLKAGKEQLFPTEINIAPQKNIEDELIGFLWLIKDISNRKQTEQFLIEAKAEAELANQGKSQFLSVMSHELRNPLQIIIGFITLLNNTKLQDQQNQYVAMLEKSSQQLLSLINDILDFSKIESGQLELELNSFSLRNWIQQTLEMIQPKINQKKLNLSYTIPPAIPDLFIGDENRLRQILLNLLNNGIKFTEQGEIKVLIEEIHQKNLTYKICFSVVDTGIGIADEAKSRLFKAFSQADLSITRKYGGTGLGLVIAKQLVEKMGGEIGFSSELGKGSTFYFTLMLERVSTLEEIDNSNQCHLHEPKPLKILLVEDHLLSQTLFSFFIQEIMGCLPDLANNGFQALEYLKTKKYDIIFMDLHMPEMDGLTATRNIYQEWGKSIGNSNFKIPEIIVITADIRPEIRDAFLEIGVTEFLFKPFTMEDLADFLWKFSMTSKN